MRVSFAKSSRKNIFLEYKKQKKLLEEFFKKKRILLDLETQVEALNCEFLKIDDLKFKLLSGKISKSKLTTKQCRNAVRRFRAAVISLQKDLNRMQ